MLKPPTDDREPRAGDIRNSLADITRAKELMGYQPTQRFADGLVKTVEFFKEKYQKEMA